jgi:hypothetical protein
MYLAQLATPRGHRRGGVRDRHIERLPGVPVPFSGVFFR